MLTLTKSPRRRCTAALAVALTGLLLAAAAPAQADYTGLIASSPTYGALGTWTVNRLNGTSGEITGTIKDLRADGKCAYVKSWVKIDFAVDPSSSAVACGNGARSGFRVYTRDLNGFDRVQGIYVKVCRSNSSGANLSDCVTVVESRETF
jgi:hypothetical protein